MIIDVPQQWAMRLARQDEAAQREWLERCLPEDLLKLDAMFETWAAEGQKEPGSEGWRVWLMMAGRGFGKTRAGAEWVHRLAMSGKRRIALVAASIDEARSVMVEGRSGLLSVGKRHSRKLIWEPSLGRVRWPNGSEAMLYSGDHPDGLRGPEFDFAWCDELAKWGKADAAWSNLQMALRLGTRPRALVTTTPRTMPLLETLRGDPWTVVTGGATGENVSLPPRFVEVMMATYGGTRIGRQELDGELMAEAEGSLFPRALLDKARVEVPAAFDRIVVGVDPSASATGDACGIVVAGRSDGKLYVLADATVSGASPERWARAVAAAAQEYGASHVVAEANQGGAMVASVLKAADSGLRVRLVHASRGKVARAEPVAIRFEVGRSFLCGVFPALEAELSGLSAGGGYDGPGRSPDRADAMVWALTELGEMRNGLPRVRAL